MWNKICELAKQDMGLSFSSYCATTGWDFSLVCWMFPTSGFISYSVPSIKCLLDHHGRTRYQAYCLSTSDTPTCQCTEHFQDMDFQCPLVSFQLCTSNNHASLSRPYGGKCITSVNRNNLLRMFFCPDGKSVWCLSVMFISNCFLLQQ